MTDEQAQDTAMERVTALYRAAHYGEDMGKEFERDVRATIARYGAWERARERLLRAQDMHEWACKFSSPCECEHAQAALAAAEKVMQEGATA